MPNSSDWENSVTLQKMKREPDKYFTICWGIRNDEVTGERVCAANCKKKIIAERGVFQKKCPACFIEYLKLLRKK